jgi:hypothetical protein
MGRADGDDDTRFADLQTAGAMDYANVGDLKFLMRLIA